MVFEEFDPRLRVIFTADNLGRSQKANDAIFRAYQEGVLTAASLPVRGTAVESAVAWCKQNPGLEVGLQLVLTHGKSVLKPSEIVGVVDERFEFGDRLWGNAFRYRFNPQLKSALQAEVDAQIRLYRRMGLPLGFISGRGGMHLHPVVYGFIRRYHDAWKIRAIRATHDPVLTHLRLFPGRSLSNVPMGLLMRYFDQGARPLLLRRGICMTDAVLGTMASGSMDLDYLLTLLEELPPGTYEVCLNPDTDEHGDELELLLNPELKHFMAQPGRELINHGDLVPATTSLPT
ncbi:MAG: ChbG/HpnK family deacetylase [Verrucomicrobia bacterium]|nr:ChbG/HpnK family deacetylase [Verrucomicrobiota bacterium]